MKACPLCKEKTIPHSWIFFERSKNRNGRCIQCSNCGKNIKKSRWLLIDILLRMDALPMGLFILFTITLFQVVHHYFISFFGAILLVIGFYMSVSYISPLSEAEESYCRGDMSKIGAVFALIAIPSIIIFTLYSLLYKPLILGEAP